MGGGIVREGGRDKRRWKGKKKKKKKKRTFRLAASTTAISTRAVSENRVRRTGAGTRTKTRSRRWAMAESACVLWEGDGERRGENRRRPEDRRLA